MTRRAVNARGTVSEAAFQQRVVGLLRVYGWERIYHAQHGGHRGRVQRGGLPEGRGFPDVVAIHEQDRRLLVTELKDDRGALRPGQREWLDAFLCIGEAVAFAARVAGDGSAPSPRVEAYLWRPADWDELHDIVRGSRPRRRDLDAHHDWLKDLAS